MINPIPAILFVVLAALGYLIWRPDMAQPGPMFAYFGYLVACGIASASVRMASQWEKALVFRLGKFQAVKGPGLFTVLPILDSVRTVDTRVLTLAIPTQQAITKDNVPVSVDGVIFLRVASPSDAVIRVQDYQHAIRQYAQTALRDVIGAVTLDEILSSREEVGHRIEQMVESEITGWGLEVAAIRIQDLILPEDLKRVMARQASAEREKRANITKSEGDRDAAQNLAQAARVMAESPGALQLRTLQTLDSLGGSSANTVVLTVPVDVIDALHAVPKLLGGASAVPAKATPKLKIEALGSGSEAATEAETGQIDQNA